jgi:predicted nucleotidyltransferase
MFHTAQFALTVPFVRSAARVPVDDESRAVWCRARWTASVLFSTLSRYDRDMSMVTAESVSLRAAIAAQRAALDDILRRYGAVNPRLFGSVARGDATSESDIDLLVDLLPGGGNELLCVAGIAEELSHVLGLRVDVVTPSLLRGEVSASALGDSVAL